MPDGSVQVKHFCTFIYSTGGRIARKDTPYIQQAIEWLDEHMAKVISISTPDTILRDLKGTRAVREDRAVNMAYVPEPTMLRSRKDLIEGRTA